MRQAMTTIYQPIMWAKTMKESKDERSVPTQEALAIACAAYRINEGYVKSTRRFSCEENETVFANKELVKFAFEDRAEWKPHDWKNIQVIEQDYETVAEIKKWMKRYVMLGLGDLDQFKQDMISSVAGDTVSRSDLGRIAFIPEFVKRDRHETGLKKEIRVEYRDSTHLGNEKDTVEGVIRILDKRYSTPWESFNYVAVMDGNLVSFMNKYEHEVGAMKRVKAKIKALTKNRLFEANETRLNYVKLYKV